MKKELLERLESDSRLTASQLAVMLDKKEEDISQAIGELENDNIICGYTTLVNWDNTPYADDIVTAIVEVKVTPQTDRGFDKIAQRIYNFDEVKSVFLMSGAFDLLVMVDGKNIKDISNFISSKLSTLDNVISTSTHFVLKKYKDHGVILNKDKGHDERMIVSP
ncbi:MAG: Lrp/AsnC family transcriptional regulator [Firmicutes bacterium]|nr:Lrp/AsnC family transcriptional regulator [Bacillota bacterium]